MHGGALFQSLSHHSRWLLRWVTRVAEFGLIQCSVQVLTGIAGLLVIRTMVKEQYALYAIANQALTTCNMLADLGIAIGLRSIGGRVWRDRWLFGGLLNAALDLRRQFGLASIVLSLPLAAWMLRENDATPWTIALLCGLVVAGVLPQLAATVYSIAPQLHGDYRRLQALDLGNATLRLFMLGTLALTHMSAILAATVGALNNWIQLLVTRRWVGDHADLASPPDLNHRHELFLLSVRTFPNVLFFCFQGQITLLILTLVGNQTGIADVTALSRLALLLTPFSATFITLLVPRFATCQDPQRLPRLYLLLIGATALALSPLLLAGLLAPGALLWLLGDKYGTLTNECGLVVTTACVAQLVHCLHALNTSRAWIRILTTAWIPLTVATQLALALTLDLHHFTTVLWFQLASASVPLPLLWLDAVHGLRRNAPLTHRPAPS